MAKLFRREIIGALNPHLWHLLVFFRSDQFCGGNSFSIIWVFGFQIYLPNSTISDWWLIFYFKVVSSRCFALSKTRAQSKDLHHTEVGHWCRYVFSLRSTKDQSHSYLFCNRLFQESIEHNVFFYTFAYEYKSKGIKFFTY